MPFQSPDLSAWSVERHFNAVAGVEARAGRDQPHGFAATAKMLAHHFSVSLEAAAGKHDGIGRQGPARTGLLDGKAARYGYFW